MTPAPGHIGVTKRASAQSTAKSDHSASDEQTEGHMSLEKRNKDFWKHLIGTYELRQKWQKPVKGVKARVKAWPSTHKDVLQTLSFQDNDFDHNLDELLKVAEVFKNTLDSIARKIVRKVHGAPPCHYVSDDEDCAKKMCFEGAPLKNRESAKKKAMTIYDGDVRKLVDVARCTIIVPMHDAGKGDELHAGKKKDELQELMTLFMGKEKSLPNKVELDQRTFRVVDLWNGFLKPTYTKYADATFILEIELSAEDKEELDETQRATLLKYSESIKFMAEVQVHVKDVFELKNESHKHYTYFRKYFYRSDSTVSKLLEAIEVIQTQLNCSLKDLKDYAALFSLVMESHNNNPQVLRSLDVVLEQMCEYEKRREVLECLVQIAEDKEEEGKSHEDLACFRDLAELLATQARLLIDISRINALHHQGSYNEAEKYYLRVRVSFEAFKERSFDFRLQYARTESSFADMQRRRVRP